MRSALVAKLATLVQTKIGVAVLGTLLIGGGAAATVAANPTLPSRLTSSLEGSAATAAATHTEHDQNASGEQKDAKGQDQNHVAVEGTLVSYAAGAGTIKVLAENKTWTFTVNTDTRVNGTHSDKLADLATAAGHGVQVQATKQTNGTYLASKVTVQAADDSSQSGSDDHGQSGGSGKPDATRTPDHGGPSGS
jgi:Domain of unknown function (DUF5666)